MKKIKYLILILPLLFISNVKAEECHNYIDFNNVSRIPGATSYNINSSDSITLNFDNNSNETIQIWSFNYTPNSYILSFDIETDTTPTNPLNFTFYTSVYPSGMRYPTSLVGDYTVNSTSFKNKYTLGANGAHRLYFTSENLSTLIIKNAKMYLESEYEACTTVPITTYTYRFLVDETVIATGTIEEGSTVSLPEDPIKDGYTFTGWTLNGEEYTGGEIHSDIDIIATFRENTVVPGESIEIDLSVLFPYLILISSLLMLTIEINFIKSCFRSRR